MPTRAKVTQRQLNRSLLARQLLLQRQNRAVLETVEHLVGMQAQQPLDPYIGCWIRLNEFEPKQLADLLVGRRLDVPPLTIVGLLRETGMGALSGGSVLVMEIYKAKVASDETYAERLALVEEGSVVVLFAVEVRLRRVAPLVVVRVDL
jgi:hypothetical protein